MARPRSLSNPMDNCLYINDNPEPMDYPLSKTYSQYNNEQSYNHMNYYQSLIKREPNIDIVYHGYVPREIESKINNSYTNSNSSNNSFDINVTTQHNTEDEVNTDRNDRSFSSSSTDQPINDRSVVSPKGDEDDENLLIVVYSEEEGTEEKPQISSKKKYKCSYCSESFTKINLRKQHEAICHTGAKLHKCDHCDMYFGTKYRKRVHELRHGTDCPYLCFKCGLGFKSLYKRQVHERTHTGKQPFRCQYCGEKFESKYKKNLHEVGHISDTPYECRYCDESFKTQYRCKQHELAHSSDKPYQCQFCNESFKSSHKRYIHTLNHSGISHPYPCPRCSDRSVSFRTTYRLRAHLASVHRLRPDEMRDLVQAASERDAFVLASTSPTNYANAGSAGGGAGPVRGLDYLRRMQDDEVVTCFSCNAQFGNKIGLISHIRAQHTFTFL